MSNKIKRVYIAGVLTPVGTSSSWAVSDYLSNLRKMIRASLDVFFAGFTPFCPALDHHFWFQLNEGEYITEAMIKRFSKDWLEVCEAVLLTPGWKKSEGTMAELERANDLDIPIFVSLEKLKKYNEEQ